jgi:tRNA (guanosine-2'-O-)-methyltransferase
VDTLKIKATKSLLQRLVMEDFDISKPSALFFGTERDGLSEEILQRD